MLGLMLLLKKQKNRIKRINVMRGLMKSILLLAPLMIFATPEQAHAGFLLGYVLGSSNGGQKQESPATNIPPACFFVANSQEYLDCRFSTAWELYNTDSNRERQDTKKFIELEYKNIIIPLQERDKLITK